MTDHRMQNDGSKWDFLEKGIVRQWVMWERRGIVGETENSGENRELWEDIK